MLGLMVMPTQQKIESVVAMFQNLLSSKEKTIGHVAKVVGSVISCFPGVIYGALYYSHLEQAKTDAIKESKGNFDVVMSLSANAKFKSKW